MVSRRKFFDDDSTDRERRDVFDHRSELDARTNSASLSHAKPAFGRMFFAIPIVRKRDARRIFTRHPKQLRSGLRNWLCRGSQATELG